MTFATSHDQLRLPTEAAAGLALATIGELRSKSVQWTALQAPGAALPAVDNRQTTSLNEGWTKLIVPSEYEDLEGTGFFTNSIHGWKDYPIPKGLGPIEIQADRSLPDQWHPDRNYHHAWYCIGLQLDDPCDFRIWLLCDAISHHGVIFVNGKQAGSHLGGYTPFEIDISALIRAGENTIAIWVQDDSAVRDLARRRSICQLDGGVGTHHAHLAGIRGGITLERRQPAHVSRIRVKTSTRQQILSIQTWVRGVEGEASISHAVFEWPAGADPVLEIAKSPLPADGAQESRTEIAVPWADAKLWSTAHPHLYVLRTTVRHGGRTESFDTRFGFREFWIEGKRFLLNGVPVRLFGDGGCPFELCSIVPDQSRDFNRAWFEILKREFHFTSVRLHMLVYPPWAALGADEAGVLVINQSGLRQGQLAKSENGGEEFLRNLEHEFDEWYWRDVNCPSVVIWDVENELIRGSRPPARMKWVLGLDSYIRKHDPDAIIEHSGAGYYSEDQQVIHIHMQEQYSRLMQEWSEAGTRPLLMGEFWIGGRGETRLPNSYEYSGREDWHREEARMYRERMLEMRYHGVTGIMPHRLTHWPIENPGPILERTDPATVENPPWKWRFPSFKNSGARGLAPVVAFVWPRSASVLEGEEFQREVVVCNDRAERVELLVSCCYGRQAKEWRVILDPAEQIRLPVSFLADPDAAELRVHARNESGNLVEEDEVSVHLIPGRVTSRPVIRRKVFVVPALDEVTARALREMGVDHKVSLQLPAEPQDTIVVVPSTVGDSEFGRTPEAVRRYLEQGGRLLVLPQSKLPRWLPLGMLFWSSVRSSIPEFDLSGWNATNKDLMFSREVPSLAANHPAFDGMMTADFKEWSAVDGRLSDDAYIFPNALRTPANGPFRVLLGATRRENASLVEFCLGAGTGILCQAQVLEQRSHPAARALFFNLLRHLDGDGWQTPLRQLGLLGNLPPAQMAILTGLEESFFVQMEGDSPAKHADSITSDLILVGDGADPNLVIKLAQEGNTLLVLSCSTSARLPGFAVEQLEDGFYSATRSGVVDHPLFWGITGASFLPLEDTPARGALSQIPEEAKILLAGHCRGHSPFGNDWRLDIGFYGLETRDPAPPLAAMWEVGKGCVIATTLEPWNQKSETHRQMLANVLANAGVPIPNSAGEVSSLQVKQTIPLKFDGKLDDWTNDMDDINFSQYSHAVPVLVTSKDLLCGEISGDLDLSGVLYLLHDAEHLYLAGILFSTSQNAMARFEVHGRSVEIDPAAGSVSIDGAICADVCSAFSKQTAGEVIDVRLLDLTVVHRQTGKAQTMSEAVGRTFEVGVPWVLLGHDAVPSEFSVRFQIQRADGAIEQVPLAGVLEGDVLTALITTTQIVS